MTDPRIEQLRALGYAVDESDGVLAVSGFGVAISFHIAGAGSAAALTSLLDPKSHAERKAKHRRHDSPRVDALDG